MDKMEERLLPKLRGLSKTSIRIQHSIPQHVIALRRVVAECQAMLNMAAPRSRKPYEETYELMSRVAKIFDDKHPHEDWEYHHLGAMTAITGAFMFVVADMPVLTLKRARHLAYQHIEELRGGDKKSANFADAVEDFIDELFDFVMSVEPLEWEDENQSGWNE